MTRSGGSVRKSIGSERTTTSPGEAFNPVVAGSIPVGPAISFGSIARAVLGNFMNSIVT